MKINISQNSGTSSFVFTEKQITILKIINRFNHMYGDCESSIHSAVFDREIQGNYWPSMVDLQECGAITYSTFSKDKHQTRCYTIEPIGINILKDYNNKRLNDLQYDKIIKRKLQKTKSKRNSRYTPSTDLACNEIKETIDKISLPDTNWKEWIESKDLSDKGKEHAKTLIINIIEKQTHLERNKSDGRISNPATMLPVSIRNDIQINGRSYYRSIDIRSCHWCLLPSLLLSSSSILTDNVDIRSEVKKWNGLFLSRSESPRVIISKQTEIPENRLKEVMNSFINSKGFKNVNGKWIVINKKSDTYRLNEWFKENFPLLHNIWINSEIKQTGNNISKHFETKLMLDSRIFEKRKEYGFELLYSYDGYEIYCNDGDKRNLDAFLDFIENLSEELIGLKLVFVSKDSRQTLEMIKDSQNTGNKQIERLLCKLEPMMEKERKLFRKYKFAQKENQETSTRLYLNSYIKLREQINEIILLNAQLIQSV